MSDDFLSVRWFRRWSIRQMIIVTLSLMVICYWWPALRLASEPLCYLLLFQCVWSSSDVRLHFFELSVVKRRWILGLMSLLLVAQLVDAPRKMFPFVNWTMYSKSTGTTNRIYCLKAKQVDGTLVQLPICPFASPTLNAASKMKSFVDAAAVAPEKKKPARALRIEQFTRALRRTYELRNPGQKVHSFILFEAEADSNRLKSASDVRWSSYYETRGF